MSRLAYLPDRSTLNALLSAVSAPPASGPSSARPQLEIAPPVSVEQPKSPAAPELATRLEDTSNLDERFAQFAEWATTTTGALSAFVTDGEGLSMVQAKVEDEYLALASEITAALRKFTRLLPTIESAVTQLDLKVTNPKEASLVELIDVQTLLGRFTIGLLCTGPLSPTWAGRLREGLRMTVQDSI